MWPFNLVLRSHPRPVPSQRGTESEDAPVPTTINPEKPPPTAGRKRVRFRLPAHHRHRPSSIPSNNKYKISKRPRAKALRRTRRTRTLSYDILARSLTSNGLPQLQQQAWGRLELLRNSTEGSSVRCMARSIYFGRNKKCNVRFNNKHVSRRHIMLKMHDPMQDPSEPLELTDNLTCHIYVPKSNKSLKPCKLNGEALEEDRPCRIYDGDVLVLVDSSKGFIGYTCRFFKGNHRRPHGVPNINYQ